MAIHAEQIAEIKDWDDVKSILKTFKSGRRTARQVSAIDRAIQLVCDEYESLTVRQLFYQLVTRDIIDKTDQAYKNLVVRRSGELRQHGVIPFSKFADATRWMRKPDTYDDPEDALWMTVVNYRSNVWREIESRVEVWCEKDALAGVMYPITEEFDVPLMVSRGYSSLTFLHSAAQAIQAAWQDKFPVSLWRL